MNAKTETIIINKADIAKWVGVAIIFAAALTLNYSLAGIPLPIRIIGWIVIFAILLGLAAWTKQGQQTVEFLGEAKMELRKVVWPSSQETIQTTGLIILMVIIFALAMWAFDSLLLFLIGLLTG